MSSPAPVTKIPFEALLEFITKSTTDVTDQLQRVRDGTSIGLTDMFQVQMAMNKLAQVTEMSSSVVSSSNQTLGSMARNVK